MKTWIRAFPLTLLLLTAAAHAAGPAGEYEAIRERLARGWNSWDTRNVLSQVLLPEGLAVSLSFKQRNWIDERYLGEALIGRRGEGAEDVRPGWHALDGRYSSLELRWQRLHARVETAHAGDDLVMLVTPLEPPAKPVDLVVQVSMCWNRPGHLSREEDRLLAETAGRTVPVFTTATHTDDPYIGAASPYLVLRLDGPVGVSTGTARTTEEITAIIERQRAAFAKDAEAAGELAEAHAAVISGLAWNTIFEPKHGRVVCTVGRLWNEEYGGYCLFGWDNFFLAYAASLFSRDLALANAVEHLRGITDEGFIPNDNRGNGCKSWDRSQPPVGGLMVRELYRRWPERWFLEETFEPLLRWNRWYAAKRLNDGLLSYGSHETKNPCGEPYANTDVAARWESGMDDSPMYEGVPFDKDRGILLLQDVGLTSLHIADCRALAELAAILGRDPQPAQRHRRVLPPALPHALLPPVGRRAGRGAGEDHGGAPPAQPGRVLGRVHAPLHRPQRPGLRKTTLLEGRGLAAAQLPHLPRAAPGGDGRRSGAPGRKLAGHVHGRMEEAGLRQRELLLDHRPGGRPAPLQRPFPLLARAHGPAHLHRMGTAAAAGGGPAAGGKRHLIRRGFMTSAEAEKPLSYVGKDCGSADEHGAV